MLDFHEARISEFRLQVIFEDEELSFGIPADVTFGDLADCIASVARFHDSAVVAVNLTMPMHTGPSLPSKEAPHGTH